MMRSLYSGVSGLSVHQTKMDVIGNNIANVNTIGFKASSVTFSDIFYQTVQSATGPNESTGAAGRNAMQIGLGSSVAGIKASITKTGGAQRTDNPFDLMITGDSFFVVNNAGTNYFTKAGSFDVDANGTLCTPTGATVMGWQVDPNDSTKIVQDTVSALQIMKPENLYSAPEGTTKAYVSGNIDNKDSQIISDGRKANITFYDATGNEFTATLNLKQSTATNQYNITLDNIVDKNGKSIFMKGSGTTADPYTATAITDVSIGGISYKAAVNATSGLTLTASGTASVLEFNSGSGDFVSVGGAGNTGINLTVTATGNSPFTPIAVDFSKMTMYGGSGKSTIEGNTGASDGTGKGRKAGNMTGIGVDNYGKIFGKYDNGDSRLLGQIAVASFANPAGLEAVGDNMFSETQNSGSFDGIGHDVSSDGGKLTPGVVEMSNVDLAAQFTEMITTQRGFQANSRIITTSDTLLEELINLKR
jgi:flagellar hook protein FlgE